MLYWVFIFNITAVNAGIRFFKERIVIDLLPPDTIEVKGTYLFRNQDVNAASLPIIYPFPTDSSLSHAFNISVISLSTGKNIQFLRRESELEWNYSMSASSMDSILVIYRQQSNNFSGRYIVTTTRFWGRPLESAEFIVTCPYPAILTYLSFAADSVFNHENALCYKASFSNFFPDSDILFSWKTPGKKNISFLKSR